MQRLTTATRWEPESRLPSAIPMYPVHAPDVQLRVTAPVALLHTEHAGRMLFRR